MSTPNQKRPPELEFRFGSLRVRPAETVSVLVGMILLFAVIATICWLGLVSRRLLTAQMCILRQLCLWLRRMHPDFQTRSRRLLRVFGIIQPQ
jgi:hypothetical protein